MELIPDFGFRKTFLKYAYNEPDKSSGNPRFFCEPDNQKHSDKPIEPGGKHTAEEQNTNNKQPLSGKI